jgi:type VI secretion system protein ImpH
MSGWRQKQSVKDWLFKEGYRFNFYQAVRILERLRSDPDAEPVRFRSRVGFDFSASEIHQVSENYSPEEKNSPPEMVVNFMGLAGSNGPLPVPFTERVLHSIRHPGKERFALRDFLDIFNHRLVSLLYKVKQAHRPALTTVSPDRGIVAQYLFALFGLGLPKLRHRLAPIPDRALLYYSGLLSQRPRSCAGLQRLLSDYFQIEVQVAQFVGAWHDLSADQWTILGTHGRNCELGQGAVLGKRTWDQHSRISIRLGPMNLETFESFLPDEVARQAGSSTRYGTAYEPLCRLTRFYLGEEQDFVFQLVLRTEVPCTFLGPSDAGRQLQLGRRTWLRTNRSARPEAEVELYPGS